MASDIVLPRPQRRTRCLTEFAARIACATICLFSAVAITCVILTAVRTGRLFDFAQEWTSVRNFLVGLPVYLDYRQSLEIHLGGSASPTFTYNAHPPGAVLLALPFGLLEYRAAYLLWSVASLICLGLSFWLLLAAGQRQRGGWAGLGLLTLVVSGNAFTHQMIQGQLNLVLLALIAGAWWADRRDLPATSGVLIGVAAATKVFPAFLILFHVAQRKWRAVGGTVVGFLAFNGLGCLVFGPQAYRDYFLRVAPDVAKFRDTWPNASLLGFWSKLFDGAHGHVVPLWHSPSAARTLTVLSCLILVAATLWSVGWIARFAGRASDGGGDRNLAFGLCCSGMLLASPITWDHAFLLLIPAFWFAWQACDGRTAVRLLIVLLAIVLLWLNPMTVWAAIVPDQFGTNGRARLASPACALTVVSFQFYALLGFYLLVFAALRRRRKETS